MVLNIKYTQTKDIENILKASRSKNSSVPTRIQQLYIEQFGPEFHEEGLREFLDQYFLNHKIDIDEQIQKITTAWERIEAEAYSRLQQIFNLNLNNTLTAYLTTDSRCTYNTENNYFFVSYTSQGNSPNLIILHELLHFYTRDKYFLTMQTQEVSSDRYNDFKEALTVLLNLEFSDLLAGSSDRGYPQHQQLRAWMQEEYQAHKNLDNLAEKFIQGYANFEVEGSRS
jgi:hypothetical protein